MEDPVLLMRYLGQQEGKMSKKLDPCPECKSEKSEMFIHENTGLYGDLSILEVWVRCVDCGMQGLIGILK